MATILSELRFPAMDKETPSTPATPSAPESLGDVVDRRISALTEWLRDNASRCGEEQRHLDAGSREQAYWHYGYLVALRDLRDLISHDRSALH